MDHSWLENSFGVYKKQLKIELLAAVVHKNQQTILKPHDANTHDSVDDIPKKNSMFQRPAHK
jgi:hypothetical protein